MINGVIVTTFSAIREDSDQRMEDKLNKCYLCSIDKVEFEKRKVSFAHHIDVEHNIHNYLNYILYLKFKKNKDLDFYEVFVKKNVLERNIYLFPIYRSKSLGGSLFKAIGDQEEK